MKRVYVLEKWLTRKAVEERVKGYTEIIDKIEKLPADDPRIEAQAGAVATVQSCIDADKEKLKDKSYEGEWVGYEGKVIRRQFIERSREHIRHDKGAKWRVLKAEIEDGVDFWSAYKNGVEDLEGMRYLNLSTGRAVEEVGCDDEEDSEE